jgi:DNA-binding response OmpR family regulator
MRILIIEDEYNLADMIRDYLKKENYIIDIALDGEEGLYKAEVENYDILILDVMLPKLNGFEVLRRLRENNHKLAVLMLTAKSELEDKLFGLDSGADDYMTKPFEMKELLARVRVLARRNGKQDIEKTGFADLKLEPTQCKLICQSTNQDILLGSKEYMLLEYLMLNGNCIISKEQISNKIWGYESDVEYNSVEVYISFLRKKISFLNSIVKIKTLRGLGYCLETEKSDKNPKILEKG